MRHPGFRIRRSPYVMFTDTEPRWLVTCKACRRMVDSGTKDPLATMEDHLAILCTDPRVNQVTMVIRG